MAPIVVIGGGPAGSICARRLALLGRDVLLVDRTGSRRSRIGETCGPGIHRLLAERCDLSLPRGTHRPLTALSSAWGAEEIGYRSFTFWQAQHAIVLERTAFDEWLLGSAEEAGATVLRRCHVTHGRKTDKEWILDGLVEGKPLTLTARFVVEATGPRSRSIVLPDAGRFFTDKLVCLSVELPEHRSGDPHALVESCRAGWWYTVRLPDRTRIVALFTDADLVPPAKYRLDWLDSVLGATSHVRRLARRLPDAATVDVRGARTSARNVLWRNTWISIGDAAWSLDPLSGSGIERSISSGIDAADSLSSWVTGRGFEPLRTYALSQAQRFRESLTVQRQYYGSETRWKDAAFWRRRR